jgi:protein-L-isoaspartate(D-aspartate) O-methyltransferase
MQSNPNTIGCRIRIWCFLSLLIAGGPLPGMAGKVEGQGAQKKKNEELRHQMVERFVRSSGVTSERVLASMKDAPREMFVPEKVRDQAYLDAALPIGHDQTISSPFIVAFMTEAIDPQPEDRVLEIGTGSGYQAAILSPLVKEVFTIEIVEPLGKQAEKTLQRLKYENVYVRVGDGFLGWPEQAPFNKIIVTCSPENVPEPLKEQLAEGGLMVIPVGERHQQYLMLYRKVDGELEANTLQPTLFVPMTGEAEEQRKILPDAANPQILNGDFEEDLPENGHVAGWYYQRYMELVEDPKAPSGTRYVRFSADTPGRNAHLMQGFAIDGNEVGKLRLSASVKFEKVIAGPNPTHDLPVVHVTFYDAERRETGSGFIGPFRGTRDWQNLDHEIEVPENTNEAIVRIGLFGATGIACFDNIMIRGEKRSR